MDIKNFTTPELAAEAAGAELSKIVSEAGTQVLLLVSGGSAFKLLNHVDPQVLNSNLTVSTVDERYSKDPDINNFGQLKQTEFFSNASAGGVVFLSTEVSGEETFEVYTARFKHNLETWFKENPSGKVVVTLGMGPDGHTAGIMPCPEDEDMFTKLFEQSGQLVVGYDASEKSIYPNRVTITNVFLRDKVDAAIAFVAGEDKKDSFKNMLEDEKLAEIPARIWHSLSQITIFTSLK